MMREQRLFLSWRRTPVGGANLDDAYALAREITRDASRSFYLSTLLLPLSRPWNASATASPRPSG